MGTTKEDVFIKNPEELPEEFKALVYESVRVSGYATLVGTGRVGDDVIPFVHSAGLCKEGWPEIIVVSNIPKRIAKELIWDTVTHWKANGGPFIGEIVHITPYPNFPDSKIHCRLSLISQHPPEENVTKAVDYLFPNTPYQVVQLVITDFDWLSVRDRHSVGGSVKQYFFDLLQ